VTQQHRVDALRRRVDRGVEQELLRDRGEPVIGGDAAHRGAPIGSVGSVLRLLKVLDLLIRSGLRSLGRCRKRRGFALVSAVTVAGSAVVGTGSFPCYGRPR